MSTAKQERHGKQLHDSKLSVAASGLVHPAKHQEQGSVQHLSKQKLTARASTQNGPVIESSDNSKASDAAKSAPIEMAQHP